SVAQAYTPPKSFFIPPARTTSRPSMVSAPASIPATIDTSFGTGLAAPDLTRPLVILTCSCSRCRSPACSASSRTGTRPACDTRFSSSKVALFRRHVCDAFTDGAPPAGIDGVLVKPDLPSQKGTFVVSTRRTGHHKPSGSTDSGYEPHESTCGHCGVDLPGAPM